MWKFILGKDQKPERHQLQKELFAFRKTVQHGFPHKPTALAYDAKDHLMAIGTHTGAIKVFGRPGVEFYGQHSSITNNTNDLAVQLLEWVPGSGRILSLTTSNQLVLWEPAGAMLVPIKTLPFDGKLKKVSSLCCSFLKDVVWIGTEGGNVYQFDIASFTIREPVIYHDVVVEQVPPTYKLNPGAIESIRQLPTNYNQLLIAYNRGLCVLWDLESSSVVHSFISPGHGQSVGLHVNPNGITFTWYHADGSHATWNVDDPEPPENQNFVPYGPDPCKSINRLIAGQRDDEEIVVFSGGMPRSAYGEHQCVSVHSSGGTKVCFDFTSKVIDFFVTFNDYNENQVEVLIVLLEEELCAFDLTDPALPSVKSSYLHSIHASAVTCNHLVSQVSADVYEKIFEAGQTQQNAYSEIEWPITGGNIPDKENSSEQKEYEILLTGHEDGSVKFWDCTGVVLTPLLHLKTAPLFGSNEEEDLPNLHASQEQLDDSEPPFRKAGVFDPYSDDPRLAVKKVALCPKTGQIAIAGTAGHVVMAGVHHIAANGPMNVSTMNLVSDRDGFVWKGHDQLKVKAQILDSETLPIEDGIQITGVLQVFPPAAINCLALQTTWNLVAAGTAHGLIIFDYVNHQPVLHQCTLNPKDLSETGEALSRRKSFKKTLRESFRRLRRGRSTRNNPAANVPTIETRPVERKIEARATDDATQSMVRCLTFAQTYITNNHTTTPTLWAGTKSLVNIYTLHIPLSAVNPDVPADQRKPVTGQLVKSIIIKHDAPIVGITVFDNAGFPVELAVAGKAHRVVVATEDQFKIFPLPLSKSNANVIKYKLAAKEGARVRRMSFATFSCKIPANLHPNSPGSPPRSHSRTDTSTAAAAGDTAAAETNGQSQPEEHVHTEVGLLCLTNCGDCLIFSVPDLKRQINAAVVRKEDINAISSLCFTNSGEALYMMSSSELQRISLSATKVVSIEGTVDVDTLSECDDKSATETEQNISAETVKPLTCDLTPTLNGQQDQQDVPQTNGASPIPTVHETTSSSFGDVTEDSIRDHLNSTITTLHSTTTEEILGRLTISNTKTNNMISSIHMKDIPDINLGNFKDLSPIGDTTETSTNTVVVKSVITSVMNGPQNGEVETVTTTTTTRKESQF